MRDVRLVGGEVDSSQLTGLLGQACPQSGGLVSFTGQVRGTEGTTALELSHYEPLTLPGMMELTKNAFGRFSLEGVIVHHRIGLMAPGDTIVFVGTAARHRRAAFDAADFLMDHLKSAAWFWKRERRADGWHWIEPRDEDHSDLRRWH